MTNSRVLGLVARLRRAADIDFHVAFTLVHRGWGIVAGAVTMFVVPATLTPLQQGYYFTFASLLAIQIFFELGLNQVVVQLVSHEMAHLGWDDAGRPTGDVASIDRLRSLRALLHTWYAVAAMLFAGVTAAVGIQVFSRHGSLPTDDWLVPWLALVAASAANLYLSPSMSMLEGCGQVGQVARLRLMQSVLGYSATWLAFALGAALWAVPVNAALAVVVTWQWIRSPRQLLRGFDAAVPVPEARRIDWRREVLPFQWRIAVSWISGYLIFQLFTPMTFVEFGAVEAGRLGIALAIFSALLSVGVAWINAKVPKLTTLIARGDRAGLDQAFGAVWLRASLFTTLASGAVVGLVTVGRASGLATLDRITSGPVLACIAVATCANVVIYGAAAYMRAHREEPMLPISVASGLLILLASYYGARHGVLTTMLLQAVITVAIALPWTLRKLAAYRSLPPR